MKGIMVISAGKWVKLFLILLLVVGMGAGIWGQISQVKQEPVIGVMADGVAPETDSEQSPWMLTLWDKVTDNRLQNAMAQGWSLLNPELDRDGGFVERTLSKGINAMLGFDPTNPMAQLEQGMTALALGKNELEPRARPVIEFVEQNEDYYVDTSAQLNNWQFEMSKLSEIALSEDNMVLLYHTHNAETYHPSDGVSKLPGENGGVSKAADVFKNALENKYGIKTMHCKILHDYPDWNRSYINSLNSVQSLLSGNPKIQAVFDVHRDAGFTSKEPTTIEINGQKAAKIMIVIGANHDNWQSNLAFAQKLEDHCNAIYPGLLKDIRIVQANRYNQQAHPQAIILEVGSDLNTQEEANFSMECFAQIVAEVLLNKSND